MKRLNQVLLSIYSFLEKKALVEIGTDVLCKNDSFVTIVGPQLRSPSWFMDAKTDMDPEFGV